MLVCPQCQFENPSINNFCQKCGTSLVHITCPGCGSAVPFEAQHCQNCGTATGTVWLAVVSQLQPDIGPSDQTTQAVYLDSQQRYRILEPLPNLTGIQQATVYRVLDCQPFQVSPLAAIAQADFPAATPETSEEPAGEAQEELSLPSSRLEIPEIAQPYLQLQSRFYQVVPILHDAWLQSDRVILLLEDRSALPQLTELNQQDSQLPPLQILHWLYELTELWAALEPWQQCQTLLEPTNLRVDEDAALCLQQLYPDLPDTIPTLADLGHTWQGLFQEMAVCQTGSLALLLADLQAGKLVTVDQVQARIEAIAHELQADPTAPVMPPESTEPDSLYSSTSPLVSSEEAIPGSGLPPTLPPILEEEQGPTTEAEEPDTDSDDMPTVVLPMQLFSLEDAGRTDIGRQRDHNEDYFGIETQIMRLEGPSGKTVRAKGLYVLCDGMGGHAGGEVASALAVDTLRRYFQKNWPDSPLAFGEGGRNTGKLPPIDTLREAVQLANKAIYDVNQQNARFGSGRMGTTLVMLLLYDTEVAIAHVGDSRLYRYTRKRGLEQLTTDHEVGQREIQRGVEPEIAYARPDAYQLTQALGPRDEHFVNPDIQYLELNEDTLLILASDGLTDNSLLETYWQSHIDPLIGSQANLDKGVRQLIDLANQHNGHDNITAIVLRAKVRPNLEQVR